MYDWKPITRLRLFHGRDDRTVPYISATRTLQAMQLRGATDVSLTDCTAVPAGHLECVPEYFGFVLGVLGQQARDL